MNLDKQTEKRIIYAVVVNYGIYLLMRLFFYTTYESQMDVIVQAGLSGISGTRTPYLLYINILLGWILKGLATIMPFMNWYYMYLCGSVIISLSLIGYVILKRAQNKIGFTVMVVFSCFVGYECYVLPGNMKTAAVLGAAVLVILADYMESGILKRRKRECLLGVLAVIGSMTCFSAFIITMCSGLFSMLVYYGIQRKKGIRVWISEDKPDKKFIRYGVILLACVLAAIIFFRITDIVIYHVSGKQDDVKYRSTVTRMYGYGIGDYNEVYQEKYGIDSAEYAAIKNGSFGVSGESSWETLKKISKEGRDITFEKINAFFKKVPMAWFRYGIFYLFIVMLFMLFFSPVERKKIFIWVEVGLLLLNYLVAYMLNAWSNNWMAFILILPLLIPILISMRGAKEEEYQYFWAYLVILNIILYSKFSSGIVSSVTEENMADRFVNLNLNQVNMIDINAYLKSFNASRVYTANLLADDSIKVSNGAYALMDGFENNVMTAYSAGGTQYQWIYNPKNLNIQDFMFED